MVAMVFNTVWLSWYITLYGCHGIEYYALTDFSSFIDMKFTKHGLFLCEMLPSTCSLSYLEQNCAKNDLSILNYVHSCTE